MKRVRVVIVSPIHASNVGAIARLSGNFGVDDTCIVSPRCDIHSAEAKMLSTHHAESRLNSFKICNSLRDAVVGSDIVVGFSRRVGDLRRPDLSWNQLSHLGSLDQQLCLVFGPEDVGLSHDDLTLCTNVCALPTHADVPSMNLSQAVAVVLAGVFWQSDSGTLNEIAPSKNQFASDRPISSHAMLSLVDHWRAVMVSVGLTRDGNPDRLLHHYHRLLNRAKISDREGQMLRGFLSQVQIKLGTRKIKKETGNDDDL